MKWIEIITLRSLVKANRQLVDELLHQLLEQKESGLAAYQLKASTTSFAKYNEAVAATRKAESDELQARLGCALAIDELSRIMGTAHRPQT